MARSTFFMLPMRAAGQWLHSSSSPCEGWAVNSITLMELVSTEVGWGASSSPISQAAQILTVVAKYLLQVFGAHIPRQITNLRGTIVSASHRERSVAAVVWTSSYALVERVRYVCCTHMEYCGVGSRVFVFLPGGCVHQYRERSRKHKLTAGKMISVVWILSCNEYIIRWNVSMQQLGPG